MAATVSSKIDRSVPSSCGSRWRLARSSCTSGVDHAAWRAQACTHGWRQRCSGSVMRSTSTASIDSSGERKRPGQAAKPLGIGQARFEQGHRRPVGPGQRDVEPLDRQRVRPAVALGELERHPLERIVPMVSAQSGQHAPADEIELVAQRRLQALGRRMRFAGTRALGGCGSRARGRRGRRGTHRPASCSHPSRSAVAHERARAQTGPQDRPHDLGERCDGSARRSPPAHRRRERRERGGPAPTGPRRPLRDLRPLHASARSPARTRASTAAPRRGPVTEARR